jgi:uncharacterized protein
MTSLLKRWLAAFALLAVLLVGTPALAAPEFPALTDRVVDQANILAPAVRADLTAKLAALEAKTSRQLVVVTVTSLQGLEIEDYGYQLGRAWGIGEAKRDTGVLLLVAPNERRVRIEVGYGLEGILTDALSNVILQEQVLPHFRAGDMAEGVVAGANALIEQLSMPDAEAKARAASAAQTKPDAPAPFPLMIVGLFVLWVAFGLIGSISARPGHRTDAWLLPLMFIANSSLGRGSGKGGGFSGGGGSFGGGGASGRW